MAVVVPFPTEGPPPPPRRRALPLRRLARFVAAIFVLCAAASFPSSAVFDVRQIVVTGNRAVPSADVLRRAGLDGPAVNAFRVDAAALRARLLADPRIEDVSVQMAFPTRLTLGVRERPPVAALQLGEGYVLVSGDAVAIASAEDPGPLVELIVDGLEPRAVSFGAAVELAGAQLAAHIAAALPASLRDHVVAVQVDRHADAVLILRDGPEVRLGGRRGIDGRLEMTPRVLEALAARGVQVAAVDLRVAGNVIIQPQNDAGPPGSKGGAAPAPAPERQEKAPERGIEPAHRPSVP